MKEGDRTPWGKAQDVEVITDGIEVVSTSSHGGIKLGRFRNSLIPKELRKSGGWYEEDCESLIPMFVFYDEFKAKWDHLVLEDIETSLDRWFPGSLKSLKIFENK